MKNLISLFVILLCSVNGFSQEYVSSMYWENYSVINPAASGFENKLHSNIQYQLLKPVNGLDPQRNVSFDVGFKLDKFNSGVGVNVVTEQYKTNYGVDAENVLNANYNYQFTLLQAQTLSIGASLGFKQFSNQTKFSSNFGLLYKAKGFRFSYSSVQFNSPSLDDYKLRYFYAQASYELKLKPSWKITPSMLFMNKWTKGQYFHAYYQGQALYKTYSISDVGARLDIRMEYKDLILGGIGIGGSDYGYSQNITFRAGAKIDKQFSIIYSISFTKPNYSGYYDNLHQFSLSYNLN